MFVFPAQAGPLELGIRLFKDDDMETSNNKSHRVDFYARRRVLRRLALLGAVAITPAILGFSGCQSMKNAFDSSNNKKEPKTIDDVLNGKRPEW